MTELKAPAGRERSPMRARFREQVREDVKTAALTQLAEGGPAAVSINAIAKGLGVSGPALYRYFASRDDLLSALVVDAYHDLATALADAIGGAGTPTDRLRALASGWRAFAHAAPHRYQLLFAPPLPGYDAHAAPLVEAARTAMAVALDVFGGLEPGQSGDEPFGGAMSGWIRIHGFISLELGGNFASMGLDADALFASEVDALARDRRDPAGPDRA